MSEDPRFPPLRKPPSWLCGPCRAEWWDACLYRARPSVPLVHHAAYDATAAGVRDALRAREDDRRSTVEWIREMTVRVCQSRHQRPDGPLPAGQLALFEISEAA